jgi:hypothetical protein
MLETCWKPAGNQLETSWKHAENLLETCWKPAGKVCFSLVSLDIDPTNYR